MSKRFIHESCTLSRNFRPLSLFCCYKKFKKSAKEKKKLYVRRIFWFRSLNDKKSFVASIINSFLSCLRRAQQQVMWLLIAFLFAKSGISSRCSEIKQLLNSRDSVPHTVNADLASQYLSQLLHSHPCMNPRHIQPVFKINRLCRYIQSSQPEKNRLPEMIRWPQAFLWKKLLLLFWLRPRLNCKSFNHDPLSVIFSLFQRSHFCLFL